ncbi:MAG: hypothetical protein HYY78_13845 [Betaproteobacteria bacterium]|nr:hypothetical protein [Betaproteobacteria bacterium]
MQPLHTVIKKAGIALLLSLSTTLGGIVPAAHATESWVGNGAPGEGGLVRGLYIVPNTSPTTLLAAVYGAGIFKSTDGGNNWAPSNTGLVNKRVRQVKGQPVAVPGGSPAWILAATEGGMYRSTDGGTTWSASNTGLQCLVVSNLDVFNSATSSAYGDQNTVYAGTACATNSGVYRSTDGGVSWSKADWSSLSVSSAKVNSITVAGSTPGQIVWVSTDGQGLFRSADGGATWVRRNGTSTNILSGPNGSGNSAYVNAIRQGSGFVLASVEGGGVYRSADNGANWFALNGGLPTNPTILNGPISNVSGQQYVAVAGIGFYQNSISGTSTADWTFFAGPAQGLPAMARGISTDPNTSTTWYATTIAGVYRSLDSGASWSPIVSGIGGGYAHSSTTDPNNPSVVLGAADAMYRSTDGGVTWVKSSTGLTDHPITPRFARGLADVALAGTTDSGVFKTIDGGATWFPSNTGLPAAASLVGQNARMRTDPIVNGLHYVTLEGQGVYKSVDYGATWTAINNGLSGQGLVAMPLGIDPVNSSNLYLTTAGGYYRSTDAGASWSLMPGLPTSGVEAGLVRVDPNDPSTAYAAVFITGTNAGPAAGSGVWKTTNSGSTWTQVLNNKLVHRVVVTGAEGYSTVYAAAWDDVGGGVLKSIDGGATWNPVNTGLNSIYIRQFETSAGQARLLRASAIGGGIMNFTNGVDTAVASLALSLENLKTIINTNGASLDYTHLLGGYDAGFLSDGENATADAKFVASDLRGVTIDSITITKVNSYDDVNGILNVAATFAVTTPGGPATLFADGNDDGLFIFKRQLNGSYLTYGNQQIARTSAQVEMRTDYGPFGNTGPRQHVNFDIEAPQGVLSTTASLHTATASPNSWTGLLPQSMTSGGTRIETVQGSPAPAPVDTFTRDAFFGGFDPGATPVVNGTVFQYTLTRADTSTVTYSVPFSGTALNNPGTDAITNVTINGTTATSFAPSLLSSPLNLAWTLPTGFPIREVRLWGYVQNSINEQCSVSNDVILGPTATNGQVTLPSVCGANPIVRGGVNVTAEGLEHSGQRAMYIYNFDITVSGSVPPAPVLSTPGLGAQSQVGLAWNAVSGATSYNVYRRLTPSGTYAAIVTGYTGTDSYFYFVDTTLVGGTAYEYYITAVNDNGESGQSNVVAVTTANCPAGADCTSPSVVTGVVATAAGPNQVNVNWTASSDASGISHYRIGRCVQNQSNSCAGIANTVGAPTNYTDYTATANTPYYYWVLAIDNAGNISVTSSDAGGNVTTPPLPATLWIRFQGPNGSNFVRQGLTGTYTAVLVKGDGTVVESVTPTWSITSGPATVNSGGVVTGGAVSVNTQATLQASFADAVLTGGATIIATQTLTIQASQDSWTGGGAPGQGGDARGFVTVGSDRLVAIYGGGIYRSSDGGGTWKQSGYGIPFRSSAFVRNLRMVPGSTSHVLASVEGRGIFRSVDGGATWTSSNTGMGCNYPRGYAALGTTLYVASNCGLYMSTDAGNTWSPTGLTGFVQGVDAFGTTTPRVWAWTHGNGLYRSTDGGATWQQRNTGLFGPNGLQAHAFRNVGSGVHFAMIEGSGIFQTTDFGASWFPANNGLPGISTYSFQGGNIGSPGDGYLYVAVEGYGVYRGTTGATLTDPVTWSAWGSTASQLPLRSRPPSRFSGIYYVATGQGVFQSADNGVTWTKTSTGLPGGFTRTSETDPTDPNIVYATADTVYKSTDGGATWVKSASGITSAHGGLRGSNGTILRRSDGALYVGTANGGIFKSIDAAASWFPVNNGLPELVGQGVAVRGGLSSAPQTLYALYGQDPRGVYHTNDGGASWTSISGDLAGNALYTHTIATDPATGDLYLGTEGGLYKSVNGGTNWTPVYTANPLDTVRVDTGVSPSAVYWSTYVVNSFNVPQASSGLYRSLDGGATFTQLLSGYPVQNLRVLRPGGLLTLYAVSWRLQDINNGVLRSIDGGATWQAIKAGMSHRFVGSLDVVGDQLVRASTRGGGVYTFVPASDTTAPTVPGSFTATPVSNSQINLAWTASTDAVGVTAYQVFRGGVQVGTTNSATFAFSDTGLAASTLYNYGVRACDAAGNCSAQATTSATTQAAADTTPPSVPAGLTANAVSSSQIDLAWTASTDNVGVDHYHVYRDAIQVATLTGAPPVTSYSDVGLTASTTYSYTVNACDAAENCSAQSGSASATTPAAGSVNFTANLETGFNMIGNALNITLDVPALFGNQDAPTGLTSNIVSVWKWNAVDGRWAFYAPQLTVAGIAAYAAPRNYEVLATVEPGEGYWVNAIGAMSLPTQSGTAFNWNSFNFAALPPGFNLISHATAVTPSQFNNNVSQTPPAPGVIPTDNFTTLWVWDAVAGTWYFYSPLLESTGGLPAVKAYADSHFFRHFQDYDKTIDIGVGFWVNRP